MEAAAAAALSLLSRTLFSKAAAGSSNLLRRMCSTSLLHRLPPPSEFRPEKALVLTKVSRFEYERARHKGLSESQLEAALTARGSNYSLMKKTHLTHKANEERLVRALENAGVETRLCNRRGYGEELIKWADVIFTAGGDGAFLMAASKILNASKPIVGFNTDPTRSEGHLCMPRRSTSNEEENEASRAVSDLMSGRFRWFLRKRLRITLIGDKKDIAEPPHELHSQQMQYPEYRYVELIDESDHDREMQDTEDENQQSQQLNPIVEDYKNGSGSGVLGKRILPVLALNEVFLGENLSARVSYLEVKLDEETEFAKTRNSGLCVSTGTGSTSWTFNINKLTNQNVEELARVILEELKCTTIGEADIESAAERGTRRFNNAIVFDPEENLMAYTVRDPVGGSVMAKEYKKGRSQRQPRGTARRIEVKSRCFDACLVIDGSLSFKFNDGTKAIIEILDEDALRTVQFIDD